MTDPYGTNRPPNRRNGRSRLASVLETHIWWWIPLVIGIGWLIFAMIVLQLNLTSAWAIAVAIGLLLVVASFTEVVNALAAPSWQWLHAVLAGVFFIGGITALVWPQPTFLALARIVAWLLFFKGCADIILALGRRLDDPLWWLRLILGALEIGIAFWAGDSPHRSALLLALWVGLSAIAKGVTDIVLAFGIRSFIRKDQIESATPAPDTTTPTPTMPAAQPWSTERLP
jgi:hypothetical protein